MSTTTTAAPDTEQLCAALAYLKLLFFREHYATLVQQAAEAHWDYAAFLSRLVEGEVLRRHEGSVRRRVRQARFPVVKTLEQFQWSWPRKINRLQVQDLFRLDFIKDKANVIFLGGVGLGKTHLVHALGNEVLRHAPDKVIRYIHAEDYYSDVVRAYQQKSFDIFKRTYRTLDVLLVDDIQFFNGKARTQEEFFYVFNALVEAKKQIIITCDTYPKDIQGLEERLISRFDWGLTVQIEPPELEMRVAILKKKADTESIALGDDVAFLIAKNLRSNVRELEGALKKVLAFARFHHREITLDLAKEALKDIIGAHNRQITLEVIQKTVSDYFKIKVADMYSQKRTRAIARPRQLAMWLARDLTPHSLPEIGEAFGGRDHTTVLHACRTIADLRGKDAQLNNDLLVLSQTLKG